MAVRTFWTDERLEMLRRLAPGNSASQIAVQIGEGATRSAVIGACHRFGIQLGANRPGMTATSLVDKRERAATKRQRQEIRVKTEPKPPHSGNVLSLPLKPRPHLVQQPPGDVVSRSRSSSWSSSSITAAGNIVDYNRQGALYCGNHKYPGSSYCRGHALRNTPGVVRDQPPLDAAE